jgi:hypothetical protein
MIIDNLNIGQDIIPKMSCKGQGVAPWVTSGYDFLCEVIFKCSILLSKYLANKI